MQGHLIHLVIEQWEKKKNQTYNIRRVNEPGWEEEIAEALHVPLPMCSLGAVFWGALKIKLNRIPMNIKNCLTNISPYKSAWCVLSVSLYILCNYACSEAMWFLDGDVEKEI